MRYNTDQSFVGIEMLKQKHEAQIAEFEGWASEGDWERFHRSHYDWWVFPISRRSSYGFKWVVFEGEVNELKSDSHFVDRYRRGVELVSASWGWDVQARANITSPKIGQHWHTWPVRLYKATQSVDLFGYRDLLESLKIYANELMRRGESMSYNGRDLSLIFRQ